VLCRHRPHCHGTTLPTARRQQEEHLASAALSRGEIVVVEDTAALSLVPRAAVLEGEGLVATLGSAPTSSLEWCHGNADWAVREAILY
jgi:hypothetical protein